MTSLVFIDGAEGTTGLEIRERLAGRADLQLVSLAEEHRKDADARRAALNEADVVILCLPDAAAREAVTLLDNDTTRVIDASSAHRTTEGWIYGLPELAPDQPGRIAAARFVANPGCWPTGFLALVAPLIRAGLIPADWPLVYSGASGYSGGGKAMIAEFEGSESPTGYRAYGLALAHKHLPEMQRHAGLATVPVFLPAVANVYRGMLGEVGLSLGAMPRRPALADVRDILAGVYADAAGVVRLAPAGEASSIGIEADAASDRMTLHVHGNTESGQARLIATYDNLGKGAAGAAVQNLNLMLGAPPLTGLVA